MSFHDSLGMALRRAYLSFRRRAQAEVAEFGLTADQFVVLSLLAEDDGLTQRELVERTASDSSTIAAMMKILERDGLIRRARHESDGRALRVSLTPKGRRLQRKVADHVQSLRRALRGAIPAESRAAVEEALQLIHQHMESPDTIPA